MKEALQVPGTHNVSNALSVLHVGRLLNISEKEILKGISAFHGTWRRFEVFEMEDYTLVSDYGHHPTEITATIQATKEKWPDKKIILVFQPHQYQRTKALYEDFVHVLSTIPIDTLIIPDIYDVPGRENRESGVSGKILSEDVQKKNPELNVQNIADMNDIPDYLNKTISGGEVVIIMGAGDIYNLTLRLTGKVR